MHLIGKKDAPACASTKRMREALVGAAAPRDPVDREAEPDERPEPHALRAQIRQPVSSE